MSTKMKRTTRGHETHQFASLFDIPEFKAERRRTKENETHRHRGYLVGQDQDDRSWTIYTGDGEEIDSGFASAKEAHATIDRWQSAR